MAEPVFVTRATLAREWQVDIRNRMLCSLPIDAFLKMGSKKVALYARSRTPGPKMPLPQPEAPIQPEAIKP
jgi:hypothetical protein